MKKILTTTAFLLASLAMAAAQQPGSPQSPSAPGPGAAQQSMPGSANQAPGQNGAQPGTQSPMGDVPVTDGCLGGSDPNYTITSSAGTTYKLNIPPSADTSKLAPHVGEAVQVAGNVNETGKTGASIDVRGIGRGTSKCPGSGASNGAQTPPKH